MPTYYEQPFRRARAQFTSDCATPFFGVHSRRGPRAATASDDIRPVISDWTLFLRAELDERDDDDLDGGNDSGTIPTRRVEPSPRLLLLAPSATRIATMLTNISILMTTLIAPLSSASPTAIWSLPAPAVASLSCRGDDSGDAAAAAAADESDGACPYHLLFPPRCHRAAKGARIHCVSNDQLLHVRKVAVQASVCK